MAETFVLGMQLVFDAVTETLFFSTLFHTRSLSRLACIFSVPPCVTWRLRRVVSFGPLPTRVNITVLRLRAVRADNMPDKNRETKEDAKKRQQTNRKAKKEGLQQDTKGKDSRRVYLSNLSLFSVFISLCHMLGSLFLLFLGLSVLHNPSFPCRLCICSSL